MPDPLPAGRFFAAYVQAVNQANGHRWQWIVLPPVTHSSVADGLRGRTTWFERNQTPTSWRRRWNFVTESPSRSISMKLTGYLENENWVVAEPLVLKVSERAIAGTIMAAKTPYDLISRFNARGVRAGIRLDGPPSPAAVAQSPTT